MGSQRFCFWNLVTSTVISGVCLQSIRENFRILEAVACSDRNADKMERTAAQYGLHAMPYEELLRDPEIEMILNLTIPAAHFALSKAAMETGKHVYSEKTMAVTPAEGKELCRIASENHVRFGSAPDTFLGGGLQTARYLLDHNLTGRIQNCVLSMSWDYGVFGENLPHLFTKGGSVLYDMSCYYSTAAWARERMPTEGMSAAGLYGPLTMESLLYLLGLQTAAELAEYAGRDGGGYRGRAARLKAAIRTHCMAENGMLTDYPPGSRARRDTEQALKGK